MLDHSQPRSLELFFIDGKPSGMLTAEVFGWTGHILSAPRTRFADVLKRTEASYTGVYILLSDDTDNSQVYYIGEGENVAVRIKSHDAKKDWWTRVILITSAANKLHKAHVKYLESRLVQEARSSGKATPETETQPSLPSLPEAARANMESFLDQVLMVMPAIRVDIFVKNVRPATDETKIGDSPIFECVLKKYNIRATAKLVDGEFIVQAGSRARLEWGTDNPEKDYYRKIHEELVKQGILKKEGGHNVFTKNYAFSSTTAAGAVVRGNSAAGPIAWKVVRTGQTYKDWEVANLKEQEGEQEGR